MSADPANATRYFRERLKLDSTLLCGDGPDVVLPPPVNDVTLKYLNDQTLPQADVNVNYGVQGVGGTFLQRQKLESQCRLQSARRL